MRKLLLVDGCNLLCQMLFGMPARITNKDGKAIHGTLGFVGALNKIIKMTGPTHAAVIFDGEHENSRAGLLPDYKANRPDFSAVPEEENPFSQLGDIYAALDFMGIKHAEASEDEADDVISAYAHTLGGSMEVVIASFDSDFFQLIGDSVSILRYRGDKTVLCDAAYLQARLGIAPHRYADFKSLTGDTADNIKGAHKVGPKTAAALINQLGGLEDIIAGARQIARPSVRESILSSAERLRINYQIIKLDGNSGLPFGIDELRFCPSGAPTGHMLRGIGLR